MSAFLFTKCPSGRKKSILAVVGFDAKRGCMRMSGKWIHTA